MRAPGAGLAAVAALATALAGGGCAVSRPLLERAIAARGGPLHSLVRNVDAEVYASFAAGAWQWRTAFLLPDHYAFTVYTLRAPDHYVYDAGVSRVFIDERLVSVDDARDAPMRLHARFTAVVNLDALLLPGARVAPVAAGPLPAGVVHALDVALADGTRYRLGFDDRLLLVWATGPLALPPLPPGRVIARYAEFRRSGGLWLPADIRYELGGAPLARERVVAACPNDPRLEAADFDDPSRLPDCPPSAGAAQSS